MYDYREKLAICQVLMRPARLIIREQLPEDTQENIKYYKSRKQIVGSRVYSKRKPLSAREELSQYVRRYPYLSL